MNSVSEAKALPAVPPFASPPLGSSPFAPVRADRILHRFKKAGWEGLVERVVELARKAESRRKDTESLTFLADFGAAMRSGHLLPNSPLLVNCAETEPRLFACFSVGVDRPSSEFLDAFRFIHDGMGGVGYAVTGREEDMAGLIRLIDDDTQAHQDGRPRPASNAVTMTVGGDIDTFLGLAGSLSVTNMNVALTDEFMASLAHDEASRRQLDEISARIHATGQPGVLFPDRIQRVARVPSAAYAANVCGEAPLSADESALLASVNVSSFVVTDANGVRSFDTDGFRRCVALCVRFLDGMHDLQTHASDLMRVNTLATRKVGVGVMGFAHALMLLGMPYGGAEGEKFAASMSHDLHEAAMDESIRLADILGTYPVYVATDGPPRRNANLAAIAGTATIALLVNASPGIEPIFSRLHSQRVMGREISTLDPVVSYLLEESGLDPADTARRLAAGENFRAIAGDYLAELCPTSLDVSGVAHIRMQAALQSSIDCGITKTVNCASTTTISEIRDWIVLSHASGCVGMTIYRDGSLQNQPMANGG